MLEGKRFWILVVVCIFILASPFIYVSEPTQSCQQARIEKDPNSTASKESQLRVAGIYYRTFRPEKAAAAYKLYWTRYTKDPQRPFAMDRYAKCMADMDDPFNAIKAFKRLGREYPNHELGKAAKEHLANYYQTWTLEDNAQ